MDSNMKEYISLARVRGIHNLKEIYYDNVLGPVWNDCFDKGEYIYLANEIRQNPPQNLDRLEKTLNKLSKYAIYEAIRNGLIKSNQYLDGPNTNVCVLPTDLIGPSSPAVTIGSGKIIILYNEYLFKSDEQLSSTVAHEYHHSAWTSMYFKPNKVNTLLDRAIFEGKAMYFQRMLYPEMDNLPLYSNSAENIREIFLTNLGSTNPTIQDQVMFGYGDIPYLFGYSEGYKMISSYLKMNPNQSIKAWTSLTPDEIYTSLKNSSFDF
ncbi:hypothetical protein ABE38_13225 [Brevibacillus agri]|nr:hypothetical protein [Brevibacillus agri]